MKEKLVIGLYVRPLLALVPEYHDSSAQKDLHTLPAR